jgi:hypothetical protein
MRKICDSDTSDDSALGPDEGPDSLTSADSGRYPRLRGV